MQWRTVIINPENWVLGEHASKDVMLWSISDMPWLHIRTFGDLNSSIFPVQLKSNSWTSVEVNYAAIASREVKDLSVLIKKRMAVLQELYFRLDIAQQNAGLTAYNFNLLDFYNFMICQGSLKGDCPPDAKIKFENSINTIRQLEQIKSKIVDLVLNAGSDEELKSAKIEMERLFFTNILL